MNEQRKVNLFENKELRRNNSFFNTKKWDIACVSEKYKLLRI